MNEFEVVIVGGGLAGLTAGMVAGRTGLSVAILDPGTPGGQVINVEKIENFPGFPQGVPGYDLGPLVQEQAEAAGAQFFFDTALELALDGEQRIVRGAETELSGRAVIIACGSSFRTLGIPGEEALLGRGVSHCATCDGPFFAGQDVCVIGGGDAAVEEAAVLADIAGNVTLYHRGQELRAQGALVSHAAEKGNLHIVFGTQLEAILGEDAVTAIRIKDNSGISTEREVSGVFIFVGLEPNTAFLQGVLDLDPAGHIVTDILMRTSLPGVFAAGDIRQSSVRQLASVAGDGATAAIAARRYLRGQT